MDFVFDYSGGRCLVRYPVGSSERLDRDTCSLIRSSEERLHLLSVSIEETMDGRDLCYDISGAINLLAWEQEADPQELRDMDRRIDLALRELDETGVPVNEIITERRLMFVDEMTGDIRLICLPLYRYGDEEDDWEPAVPDDEPTMKLRRNGEFSAAFTRIRTHEIFTIDRAECYIGKKSRSVDLCIMGNPAISRVHCVIRRSEEGFSIEDMGSSNYTYVDGRRVKPGVREELPEKCRIQLADEEFMFEINKS
ncbi:MAG: FHA domain-containing protein [Blautia sp.]|nr:FHA domain-containing protein [Blautia sp.]